MCDECEKRWSSLGVQNNDKKQEEKDSYETNYNNEIQNKIRIRKMLDAMKVRGELDDAKEEGVVQLFSINGNGLGPHSAGKIEKVKLMSKIRKIKQLMDWWSVRLMLDRMQRVMCKILNKLKSSN